MRLIDADRLKELFTFTCTGGGLLGKISNMIIEWACSFVDEMPTIEAEPVRHGRWIIHQVIGICGSPTGRHFGECSECGFITREWWNIMPQMNFCERCGASMEVKDG